MMARTVLAIQRMEVDRRHFVQRHEEQSPVQGSGVLVRVGDIGL